MPDKPENQSPWHVMCRGPQNPDQSFDLTFVKGWEDRDKALKDAEQRNVAGALLGIKSVYEVLDQASRVYA